MNSSVFMRTAAPITALMLLAGTTAAQVGTRDQDQRQRDRQTQQQAGYDQIMYVFANDIRGEDVVDAQGEGLGEITDLIVDMQRGNVPYAVVSFGGVLGIGRDSVAVPLKAFTWDRAQERYVLRTTRERLEGAPTFDADNWDQLDSENWRNQTRQAFGQLPSSDRDRQRGTGNDADGWYDSDRPDARPGDRDQRDRDRPGTRPTQDPRDRDRPGANPSDRDMDQRDRDRRNPSADAGNRFGKYALASELDDYTIAYSDGEEAGEIDDLILDRSSGHIGFVTMETGGVLGMGTATRLVPWEAITRTTDEQFQVAVSSRQAGDAPEIERDRVRTLNDQRQNTVIYSFYQVQPRPLDQDRDMGDRDRQLAGGSQQVSYVLAEDVRGKTIVDAQGENLGEMSDLIVDAKSGKTPYAVVSFGGVLGVGRDSVAVPMTAFSWDRAEERYVLQTTRQRLESAPTFDADNLNQLEDEQWRQEMRRAFGQVPELDRDRDQRDRRDGARPGDRPTGDRPAGDRPTGDRPGGDRPAGDRPAGDRPTRDQRNPGGRAPSGDQARGDFQSYILMSNLKDASLVASDGEDIGSIEDIVLDRTSGHIGFVTMGTGGVLGMGGETRIVPWEALNRVEEDRFQLSMPSGRLNNAPTFDADNMETLSNRQQTQRIYSFYQVQPREMDRGNQRDQRDQQRPGDRPGQPGDRPGGDRPGGDRPGGDRPGGDRPGGDRPGGDRPGGDRPGGDRPGGGQPGGGGGPN